MSDILEMIDFKGIMELANSIKSFFSVLINLFAQVFGWLGSGVLVALGVGVVIVIILRILGR